MNTITLLEQLANTTHYFKMEYLDTMPSSNTIYDAIHASKMEVIQQQFGDVGYLAHVTDVVQQ